MLPKAMGYYRQDEAFGWVSGEPLSKEDKRGQKRKGTFSGVCGRGTSGSVAEEVTVSLTCLNPWVQSSAQHNTDYSTGVSAFGKWRREDKELTDSLCYIVYSRPA